MPPVEKKLSLREKEVLAAWIDQGARTARPEPLSADALTGPTEEEKSFWSFQPIRRPEVPRLKTVERAGNPIDAFLLRRLKAVGLAFSPEADRRTLIRRLMFDLTGLPPTPEEIDAFESTMRRMPMRSWSTACSPPRSTASAGRVTGSTSPDTPTATVIRPGTTFGRMPISTVTILSARSTPTARGTG